MNVYTLHVCLVCAYAHNVCDVQGRTIVDSRQQGKITPQESQFPIQERKAYLAKLVKRALVYKENDHAKRTCSQLRKRTGEVNIDEEDATSLKAVFSDCDFLCPATCIVPIIQVCSLDKRYASALRNKSRIFAPFIF